jgi:plasmid stabilization system protein ParE
MTRRVRFRDEASVEITSIVDWYDAQRSGLGAEFTEEVNRTVMLATESPRMWPSWPGMRRLPEIRRAFVNRFPYSIAYVLRDDELVILAVAHHSRGPRYWRRSLRSRTK